MCARLLIVSRRQSILELVPNRKTDLFNNADSFCRRMRAAIAFSQERFAACCDLYDAGDDFSQRAAVRA